MKMNRLFMLFCFLAVSVLSFAQKDKGYVILVDGNSVFVDFTSADVVAGDLLDVLQEDSYMVHPVTGKKIWKEGSSLCTLRVTKTFSDYSEAVVSEGSGAKLKPGMKIEKRVAVADKVEAPANNNAAPKISGGKDRIPVVITPTEVNDIVGIGYFGMYVSDMLMEKMMMNDRITLLDRSILEAQMNEIDLAGRYIDAATAIEKGKIKGAKFAIQVTMQKPDVVNVRTGVPLASVMGAVQGLTGTNLGAQYFSNTKVERLKSAVDITARVIDMQTSEVVFMCSGSGKAQGKVQLGLEYGALGGTMINGGVNGFKQTVTGKAVNEAFNMIADGLNKFFNGETDARVLTGRSVAGGDELLRASKGRLYLGTQKMSKDDLASLFSENDNLYFRYKSARNWRRWSWIPVTVAFVPGVYFLAEGTGDKGFDSAENNSGEVGAAIFFWGAGAAGTYLMCWKSNKILKAIVKDYNARKRNGDNMELSLVTVPGGLGFRFSF